MADVEENRSLLRIVSLLLGYPNGGLLAGLPDIQEAIQAVPEESAKRVCSDFITHLRGTPLHDLQEDYTATFDLNPSTCLNLTFHQWGDTAERPLALAGLKEIYRSCGYEVATKELPDYLPMILEFLTVCPESIPLIQQSHGVHLLTLKQRLEERHSPYAGLLRMISEQLAHVSAEGD
jgi:nitrate reductase molybdenum cofactor assembly chaperone NarJ/NarW